jgi:hypothetical protein
MFSAGRRPGAAAKARHFVAEHITGSLAELRENAELVTSELVTNVLIHTDSPATLRVLVAADAVRVEVHDDCAVLPVGGILDPFATSGRGLVLVDRLTHRWGVTREPGAGKNVWFELVAGTPSADDDHTVDDLLDMWDDSGDAPLPVEDVLPSPEIYGEVATAAVKEPDVTHLVCVEDVPTDLLNSSKSHLDDLVRELTLVAEGAARGDRQDDDLLELGCRLNRLVVDLIDFRNEIRRQALDAAHRHEDSLALELALPASLRPRLLDYLHALDEADELCANGRLLMPPAPRNHVDFRRWKLHRIIDQLPREVSPAG